MVPENLEEPKFEIIEIYDGFEIRRYVDTIQARVVTKGMGYRNSTGAFRRIASYIFGENDQSRNIAMTAPVHMWESDDSSAMAFTMPSEHRMEDLPKPADSGVELLHVKGEVVAVLKFSGLSHRKKRLRMVSKLLSMIENNGIVAHSQARLAVYDNPTSTLPFMRRNEIIQPIEWGRGDEYGG